MSISNARHPSARRVTRFAGQPRVLRAAFMASEALEARRMLATYTFNGTPGNDVMSVALTGGGSQYTFTLNGVPTVVNNSSLVDTINLNGGDGFDSITIGLVDNDGDVLVVHGDAGDDTIRVGNDDVVANVPNLRDYFGDSGTDLLVFDDTSAPAARAYEWQVGDLLRVNGLLTGRSQGNEVVRLEAGPLADTLLVRQVSTAAPLLANMGQGDDTVTFRTDTNSSYGAQYAGANTVVGALGNDSLVFDDSVGNGVGTQTYGFGDLRFLKQGSGGTTFSLVENVSLSAIGDTSSTPAVINALALPDGVVNLTLVGGAGTDTITVGGAGDNDVEFTNVLVSGGGGNANRFILDDTIDPTPATLRLGEPSNGGVIRDVASGDVYRFTAIDAEVRQGPADDRFEVVVAPFNGRITINGGAGNDTLDASDGGGGPGTGLPPDDDLFSSIFNSRITYVGDAGNDLVDANDQNGFTASGQTTTVGGGEIRTSSSVNSVLTLVSPERVYFQASNGSQIVNVSSVAAGQNLTVVGGAGNDTIGSGANADVGTNWQGNVSLVGGGGTDLLLIDNRGFTGPQTTWSLSATSFATNVSPNVPISALEIFQFEMGNASDAFFLTNTPGAVTVNGSGGDDRLVVGSTFSPSTLGGPVTFGGGPDADEVQVNDFTPNAATYNWNGGTIGGTANSSVNQNVTYTGVERGRLTAGEGASTINVTNPQGLLTVAGQGGADTITVDQTAAGTAVTVVGGAGLDTFRVNPDGVGIAAAVYLTNEDLQTYELGAGGRLTNVGPNAGRTTLLTLAAAPASNAGVLDLASGFAIFNGTTPAAVATALQNGRNGGAWNGSAGIASATAATAALATDALGYGTGAQLNAASFRGVPIGGNSVVVAYTINGDANLDNAVNFDDLLVLAQNYGTSGRTWAQGNFDYDAPGAVGFDDLLALAQAYGTSVVTTAPAAPPKAGRARRDDVLA